MNTNSYEIGKMFNFNELRTVKEDLQVLTRGKLSMTTKENQIRIVCKDASKNSCDASFIFLKVNSNKSKKQSPLRCSEQQRFTLIQAYRKHKPSCILPDQQYSFYKSKNLLNQLAPIIKQILKQRYRQISPSEVLKLLSEQTNRPIDFIYHGFEQDYALRRQIKKKFDNLVGEVRKIAHKQCREEDKNIFIEIKPGQNSTALKITRVKITPEYTPDLDVINRDQYFKLKEERTLSSKKVRQLYDYFPNNSSDKSRSESFSQSKSGMSSERLSQLRDIVPQNMRDQSQNLQKKQNEHVNSQSQYTQFESKRQIKSHIKKYKKIKKINKSN